MEVRHPDGADDADRTLEPLSKQELITIHDAATVSWAVGRRSRRPASCQPHRRRRPRRRLLGLLFGLLFFIPLLGMAVGAAAGALGGSMQRRRHRRRLHQLGARKVTPGTSALFVMSSDAVMDKVQDAFDGINAELIQTNLSEEQEAKLREAFADD